MGKEGVNRKLLIARRRDGRGDGNGKKKDKQNKVGGRWAKGHSCVSNPSVTKHREEATSMFLHPVGGGKSLLTVKNLNTNRGVSTGDAHDDDSVSILSSEVASLTVSDSPLSIASSISTVRSMASGWSQVSHSAFERIIKKFQGDFSVHKDMLSILGAASEVIGEAGGKKNETEFFGTFMSLLDSCPPDQYQPVMMLVCIIIGKVSQGVLRKRFADIYPKISKMLSHAVENDDELLIRTSIEAFTKLIKSQGRIVFEDDKSLEAAFYMILKCSLHSKPRVRRKVRKCYKSIILSQNENNNNAVTKLVLGWILDQLACYPTCDSKAVADALTLLTACWSVIQKMSFVGAKKLYEGVLRVMSSGDSSIMKIGLCFFTGVLQNNITLTETDSSDALVSKLIVALWELQPDWRNTEIFNIWITTIFVGLLRCGESNSSVVSSYLPLLFEKLHPIWITNQGKSAVKVVKEYLPHIMDQNLDKDVIDSCFRILAKSYLIVPPNPNVLAVTDCILESLGEDDYVISGKEVFLQLVPLKEASGVSATLGKFIKAFGVETLWKAVDETIQWNVILPLLGSNLDNAYLTFWKKEILPFIGRKAKIDTVWDALIGFCRNPKDPQNFPAELVGKAISEKPELRISALSSLRQFIDWSQCESTSMKYSKNFIPLLFNLYIKEKSDTSSSLGHADAIGVTLKKYLSVCEKTFLDQLVEKALGRLESSSEENVSPIYDLIAFMSSSVADSTLQKKVIDTMKANFTNTKERKRMYRVLSSLAANENLTEENLALIHNILSTTQAETKSNAAAIRLECINLVTQKKEDWRKQFLLEVILHLVSVNAKAKRCSMKFVNDYCSWLQNNDQSSEEVLGVIRTGLQSSSSLIVSSTMYFAFLAVKNLHLLHPEKELVQACIRQLQESDDAVIWKYCLSFLNLNLSLYKGEMGPFASAMGNIAGQSKYPRREINKILARMIRIFGAVGLKAVLPNSEDSKMKCRIRNICKKLRKMKEEKIKGKQPKEENEDSGDESDDQDFGDERMNSQTPVVIKEGLVDFLNPSEMTKALISEKKPTKPEDDFKISKDGKIIIGEGEDDDDDDDSDLIDDEEEIVITSRRKQTSSASVASSRRTTKTQNSSFSMKSASRKRKANGNNKRVGSKSSSAGSVKSKKFKSSSSVGSVKKFR